MCSAYDVTIAATIVGFLGWVTSWSIRQSVAKRTYVAISKVRFGGRFKEWLCGDSLPRLTQVWTRRPRMCSSSRFRCRCDSDLCVRDEGDSPSEGRSMSTILGF